MNPIGMQPPVERVFEALPVPVFYKNREGVYVGCNVAFEKYVGQPREQILGNERFELAPQELAAMHRATDQELLQRGGERVYEAGFIHPDGTHHDVIVNKAVLYAQDGAPAGLVGTMVDITERKRVERALEHMAFHDPLTGLPNRALFMDHLKRALAYSSRHHMAGALAFIDIDRLKSVNDSLGHEGGDSLLKTAATRLRSCLRETDTLARLGGDEFICLLPGIGDGPEGAVRVAERMLTTLAQPVGWRDQVLHVSASIGVALFPSHGDDADLLLHCADSAMYQAKQAGRNAYRLYAAETNSRP